MKLMILRNTKWLKFYSKECHKAHRTFHIHVIIRTEENAGKIIYARPAPQISVPHRTKSVQLPYTAYRPMSFDDYGWRLSLTR